MTLADGSWLWVAQRYGVGQEREFHETPASAILYGRYNDSPCRASDIQSPSPLSVCACFNVYRPTADPIHTMWYAQREPSWSQSDRLILSGAGGSRTWTRPNTCAERRGGSYEASELTDDTILRPLPTQLPDQLDVRLWCPCRWLLLVEPESQPAAHFLARSSSSRPNRPSSPGTIQAKACSAWATQSLSDTIAIRLNAE